MANIRIDLDKVPVDGTTVSFKAPCNCTAIEGIKVYYTDGTELVSKSFVMRDTHGNDLRGLGNLFMKDNLVTVLLNVTEGSAYLHNADTNSYLERKILQKGVISVTNRAKWFTDANVRYSVGSGVVHVDCLSRCTQADSDTGFQEMFGVDKATAPELYELLKTQALIRGAELQMGANPLIVAGYYALQTSGTEAVTGVTVYMMLDPVAEKLSFSHISATGYQVGHEVQFNHTFCV